MNILIVRLSAIGDVIHGLPVLAAIRKNFPNANIGWIVEELSAPLLKNHPLLNKLYIIPKKRWRNNFFKYLKPEIIPFINEIKQAKWDVAIDLQGLSKSGLLTYFSGAKTRIGFAGKDSKEINRFFINKKILPLNEAIHVAEKNISLLEPIGIKNPSIEFPILKDENSEIWADKYLESIGWKKKEFILINIGAGWETKVIDINILSEVAEKICSTLSKNVLFIWGPKEKILLDNIKENLKSIDKTKWQISPDTNLLQLTSLIRRALLFVGGDTGATHISAGLDIPVVSVYGASDSRRNGPYSKNAIVIQRFDFDCVPCWKTKCPFTDDKHLQCLKSISADNIIEKIKICLFP